MLYQTVCFARAEMWLASILLAEISTSQPLQESFSLTEEGMVTCLKLCIDTGSLRLGFQPTSIIKAKWLKTTDNYRKDDFVFAYTVGFSDETFLNGGSGVYIIPPIDANNQRVIGVGVIACCFTCEEPQGSVEHNLKTTDLRNPLRGYDEEESNDEEFNRKYDSFTGIGPDLEDGDAV
ncbi:hypothetical protein TNCV_3671351 [Trichonephila clavipes]|nr:hypothetical protein TNCV_3671351 [Trichonephila clavipes]